jgi:predicted acyl esterase
VVSPVFAAAPGGAVADARAPAVPPLSVHGSVEQVYVAGARPSEALQLVDARDRVVRTARADRAGALILRSVPAHASYRVRDATDHARRSSLVSVTAVSDVPDPSFYAAQKLGPGYQYVTTRDGTRLAVNVRLPGPPEQGPYPTVIEYSGYDVANPDAEQPASRFARALGYATVGVNMRGTGCSGGAWDYFEPLQSLDGYDVVETVAAQPWVLHGRVGMVGISYSGITQLFVAATRPPHLAAITPLSVIDDTYRGVLYPGGILNTGFAVSWARDRQHDAQPAPSGGQRWARRRIAAGDKVCDANQALRFQTPSVLGRIEQYRFASPALTNPLAPVLFVDRIRAPTFLAGTWQDEQTGGHWPEMIGRFSPTTPLVVTLTNGMHADSLLTPAIFGRWIEFLDFYVAHRIPHLSPVARLLAAAFYKEAGGAGLELPPDRFVGATDYGATLARYQAEPKIRVLFDSGAGARPGLPVAGFEASFATWPVPGLGPQSWYLAPNGKLGTAPPAGTRTHTDTYRYDPSAAPRTTHPSHDDTLFGPLPTYDWKPATAGRFLSWISPPLARTTVVLGPGSVDLWLRSSAPDTDLQVTLTEVRPDGKETYVQSGWLRASHRQLDAARSTAFDPIQTHTRADARPLPAGRFTPVRVELFPFGHVFRAGSRVRVIIQAPGGVEPEWAFDALSPQGTVRNTIASSAARPSRIVLAVVPDIQVTTPLPPCPALRGQPCRAFTRPR